MPTDEERRRVAKELREFTPIDLVTELSDVDCHLATMVMGDKFCSGNCLECFETVCERLADLIETNCDREALLALADEMTWCYEGAASAEGDGTVGAWVVMQYADRIRKAVREVE